MPQDRDQVCDHCAVDDAHDRVRDPLTGENIAQRLADAGLGHKVSYRQQDFGYHDADQEEHPAALPRQPRKRPEKKRIEVIAPGVQVQFVSCRLPHRRQPRPPLMVIGGIERADRPLDRQQPEHEGHRGSSSMRSQPS